MPINKSLKNAMLTGNGLVSWTNNAPTQYNDRQRQYFSPETRTFTQQMAQYASDFVEAQVQGLDSANPLGWQTRLIRMADIVRPSAAILRRADSYKQILFADRDIEYVAPGSKIVAMGSTWLVTNPFNISGSDGKAIVQRCNAVWNYLDYYGNVVSEPIVADNERANANDSDAQQSLLISKGYFNIVCQYNDATRQIDTNTRMILGSGAYRVTGFSDFETEFTGDYETVRLLSFTARYEEPNKELDDMASHVAGGKAFLWEVVVNGNAGMREGQTVQFTAESVRNNESVDGSYPVSYIWSSDNESIATVSAEGVVTALAEGNATITATLEQNPSYSASLSVEVTQSVDGVFFTTTVPKTIGFGETIEIEAAYVVDGTETSDVVSWSFSGAAETAYKAEPSGNTATITCYGYNETPITVTASYGEYKETAEIRLEGI